MDSSPDRRESGRSRETSGRHRSEHGASASRGEDSPLALVDELLRLDPSGNQYRSLLFRLRRRLTDAELGAQESRRALRELEATLDRVTSPANRIGLCLDSPRDGVGTILLAGAEYYANIDPRLDASRLRPGTRVLVNEAYVVVGELDGGAAGPVAQVDEVLDDGRVRVSQGTVNQGILMQRAGDLNSTVLRPGNQVRVDPAFRMVLEVLPDRDAREHCLEEITAMPWTAIGGQEEAIQAIRDTIEMPALHPDLFRRFRYTTPKGFLLYGPPGCGKTMIGKAVAYNLVQHLRDREGCPLREFFMHIKGPEILNMLLGETERMVREVFSRAREKRRQGYLPFVFIDEAESILGTRRSMRSHHIANTVVPMFCTEMDGIESLQDVVIVLASNRHDLIDPAILRPGRIDRKIKVKRPHREAVLSIFRIYLTRDLPIDRGEIERHGSRDAALDALIEAAMESVYSQEDDARVLSVGLRSGREDVLYWGDLVSGAIIASVVQRAKELAIKRAVASGDHQAGISAADLQAAVRAEFSQNEAFPPTDSVEEWLKLLDYDPENVVRVGPVRQTAHAHPAGAASAAI